MFFTAFGWSTDGEVEKNWENKTELSSVWTGVNEESNTLGFKNHFTYKWAKSNLTIKAGGVRAESTDFTRTAVGTTDQFEVVEVSDTNLTAENYHLNSKLETKFSNKMFWFTGLNWGRNEFAGIRNRYEALAGVGHVWLDKKRHKFKTDYGFQYTSEDSLSGANDEDYSSFYTSYTWLRKMGKNTTFDQDFKLSSNLEESDDYRAELSSGLSVSMSERLALKVTLNLLYDNDPSFETIPLVGTNQTVPNQLDELDTQFTTSLVINF